ncbi:hypothetical protein AJ80_04372 [Polytolypa hystricis UAMH7299]|uniref:GED domain-containing protein n=1 Tax=Polytolypa hystricis (strain UAMH7299) TaxID=1447883 RepID=A0A2B7YCB0_POLH7|nr:hypothetical protein AJ80_04372 [Polytolypa hystricis UAMH7299]
MASEGYNKLADPALLDKIDKLFACNVGSHVALPQLVVVGDQSSGKSSVLEGLTRLPFPRDSGLCTRFATQITFRRAAQKDIKVSIIPAAEASAEHIDRVKAWSITDLSELNASSFARIMAEVHTVMGLSEHQGFDGLPTKTFSKDVLRLEICGPDEAHLSVIDVPGIFKNTTPGLTTKGDIQIVRDMVQGEMNNPRSVMLTVVPANVDIATQEILEMAKEVDPEGERTLGVLTKPDLVDKGAEDKVVDLIEGKESGWKMGWSLVKNPGQQELLDRNADRDLNEESFFQLQAPWNSLSKDKVGVASLRVRLQDILAAHIRREFPQVKADIAKKLSVARSALKSLGVERDTTENQQKYLLDIVTDFQRIVSLALETNYSGDDLFDDQSTRLATIVVNRNESFAHDMEKWGHLYDFHSGNDAPVMEEQEDDGPQLKSINVRKTADPKGVYDLLHEPEHVPGAMPSGILPWLEETFRNCRGFELGTFNSSLLSTILKKQSGKWASLSLGYISDIIAAVHGFLLKALERVCADRRTRENLESLLEERLNETYSQALDQVRFLLDVEKRGNTITLDPYFNTNLEKCRQEHLQSALEKNALSDRQHGKVLKISAIMKYHPMSNADHMIQDLHDILESYYGVARKRFIDSVCMQAADYHLVTGPLAPLKLFSPSFLQTLNPKQLEEIASEDTIVKRKRAQLKREIGDLEAGRKILF